MSVTDITAVVKQYGDFTTFSDVVSYESIDAVLTEFAEVLGDQAGETLDVLAREVLVAGTAVTYVGQVAQNAITTSNKLTATEVRKVVRTLKNNKARRITRVISASPNTATEPVAPAYIAMVHPNTTFDLQGEAGWTPIEKYANMGSLLPGEVGKIGDVRFIETPNAKVFAGAGAGGTVDVYATIFLASDAYGITRISGASLQNIVKPLGDGGTTDPLNQRGTTGWKATFVARILNDTFMHRVEHAVTA
jgi:N4-gp56 family major capsid protein